MTLLIVKELEFGYNKAFFNPMNFVCGAGEVTAVLGSNGRGKTTLLHTLINLIKPVGGLISHNGKFGFVPQISAPYFEYKAFDIVLMGRAASVGLLSSPTDEDEEAALEAMKRLGIEDYAGRSFNTLSGGERQLVLIARALAGQGILLILDEPASALDLQNQQSLLKLIKSLSAGGMGVLFSTHEPAHALLVADKTILLMPEGRWLYGKSCDILTESNLGEAYGISIRKISINKYQSIVPIYEI